MEFDIKVNLDELEILILLLTDADEKKYNDDALGKMIELQNRFEDILFHQKPIKKTT